MNNPNDPIRNQTCNLPACSAVPQPCHSLPQTSNSMEINQWFVSCHISFNKQTNMAKLRNAFGKLPLQIHEETKSYRSDSDPAPVKKTSRSGNHGRKPTSGGTEAYLHKHTDLQSLSLHSPKHGHPVPCSSNTQTATLLPARLQSSFFHIPVQLNTGSC